MTAKVMRLVQNTGEHLQTKRFRWVEVTSGFYVVDSKTGKTICMGDGVGMFQSDDDDQGDTYGELYPGTQGFYDALNEYFSNEQEEIGKEYFGICQEKGNQ